MVEQRKDAMNEIIGLKMELQRVRNDKFRKIKEIDDSLDEESIITTVIT